MTRQMHTSRPEGVVVCVLGVFQHLTDVVECSGRALALGGLSFKANLKVIVVQVGFSIAHGSNKVAGQDQNECGKDE